MDCPVCKDPMVILELNQVEIDSCFNCGGIWLDGGELEMLIENEVERKNLLNSFRVNNKVKEKKYKCPACRKKMLKVEEVNSNIIIDKCPNNHGLWFDKGELKKILYAASLKEDDKVMILLKEIFKSRI